jgi:hypothetical protein
MSIRTEVLAILGFFGALYIAFYLRTRWGPPLRDVDYFYSSTSQATWKATKRSMDVEPIYTPSASWEEEYYGDGNLFYSSPLWLKLDQD